MLKKITTFFESFIAVELSTVDPQHALNLAVSALLIEMVKVDNTATSEELEHFNQILINRYNIAPDEIEQITQLATSELEHSTDYYQFTSLINSHFGRQQKVEMIEVLWEIAFVDGDIDSHEEHYLRKIAELLFVPHSEFIKAKIKITQKSKT